MSTPDASTDSFAADATFRRSSKASAATVDGLVVLLDVEAGNYHGLNAVGSHIWEFLAEPHSVEEIVADLPKHFDVGPDDASQATQAFLADLSERNLIERVSA